LYNTVTEVASQIFDHLTQLIRTVLKLHVKFCSMFFYLSGKTKQITVLRCMCWVVTTKQIRLQLLSESVAAERQFTETVR